MSHDTWVLGDAQDASILAPSGVLWDSQVVEVLSTIPLQMNGTV